MAEILEVFNVSKRFGGLVALSRVSLTLREREIVGLIGPNGAGKTTLFNCISGIYSIDEGEIKFMGKDITNAKPYHRCKLGIARTFQIPKVFSNLSLLDNVAVGITFGRSKSLTLRENRQEAEKYLKFVGLDNKKFLKAGALNVVERKKLGLACALATLPKLIMIDELVAGLNPVETEEIIELIKRVRNEFSITVFWVEHVIKAIMKVADRVIVLHAGEKIAEGKPYEIASNKTVIEVYLGERYA
jgi:branched-chain amino acid transport system ATP-binding protein